MQQRKEVLNLIHFLLQYLHYVEAVVELLLYCFIVQQGEGVLGFSQL